MPHLSRPDPSEHATSFGGYIDLVPAGDLLAHLGAQAAEIAAWAAGLADAQAAHRYAPGKWSVREVVGHVADTERIFAYRALRIARGDATPLPSFDENAWAAAADVSGRTLAQTLAEFRAVRAATVALVDGLPAAAWDRAGTASGNPMTVRGAAFVIAGHTAHHMAVLRDRYGLG